MKGNNKYHDFWPTLLAQYLEEKYWISINKETLRQIMIRAGIREPKPKRKKIIRKKRERCAQYWAMIQFDGSYHNWFENGEYPCLLCAVDDATGRVYAQFSKGESFERFLRFGRTTLVSLGNRRKFMWIVMLPIKCIALMIIGMRKEELVLREEWESLEL